MNLTGYILMRETLGGYKGVQDRVYAWPSQTSDALARAFMQTTHDEPFDFVFRDRELAEHAGRLAREFEGQLRVHEVGIATDAASLSDVRLPIGIDVAYLGGDFYSAVSSGLIGTNASDELQSEYGADLNDGQLFNSGQRAAAYLEAFRQFAPSERGSEFIFYAIGSTDLVQ